MYFPKFWNRASARSPQGDVEVEAWGWSDASEAEAAQLAATRAARLAEAIARGERNKGYLYGSNPLREPILEQINSTSGAPLGVISRNAYGCDVLNTNSVLFCDIDFDEKTQPAPAAGVFASLFGKKQEAASSPEQWTMAKVRKWVDSHEEWGIQAYRTKAGLRLMATHALFDPSSDSAEQFFDAVGADPYFRRLCRIQKSFRARLTPKPWRCHTLAPPARWPFRDQREERAFEEWRQTYEQAAAKNAVCVRLEHVGSSLAHPDVQVAMKLHDERTKTDSGLPLA
jgi:hypothetical protein